MRFRIVVWALMMLLSVITGKAQTFTSGSSLVATTATNSNSWSQPVGALFSKDGSQLFVWEKGGIVYVCNRNAQGKYIKQTNPIVDISEEVGNWRDFGLLGFALDPQFQSNGRIYLYYVVDRHFLMAKDHGQGTYSSEANEYYKATIGRVTRYNTTTVSENLVAQTGSRVVLLGETKETGVAILHESHGTGSLAFAADGTLLLTMGDGASYNGEDFGSKYDTYYEDAIDDGIIRKEENVGAFRAQMLNSHNGKLLRIDPETGDGVSSNPFFDENAPRSAKSRVWALGFRNPFRMSIKPGSGSTNPSIGDIGEVFVGDVGMNTWEELNVVKSPGQNFGWPIYEGHTVHSNYSNANTQNKDEPNSLYNGSSCGRKFFRFKELIKQDNADKNSTVFNPCDNSQLIGTGNRFIHSRPSIDWLHGNDNARVGKFDASGNAITMLIGSPGSGTTGSPFRGNSTSGGTWYSGTASSFPTEYNNTLIIADYNDQWIRRLSFSSSDGVSKVDDIATSAGPVVCVVENPLDGSIVFVDLNNVKKITFGGNIPPVAKAKSDKTYGPSELTVKFDASGSYDPTTGPNGGIKSYNWTFGGISGTDNENTSTDATVTRRFSAPDVNPKKYVVKLIVTDRQDAISTDSIIISVNNTPPNVKITNPANGSVYAVEAGLGDIVYNLTAVVTDEEHDSDTELNYAWQTILKHNTHEHPEPIDYNKESTTRISRVGCNSDEYHWLIKLTVTDAAGLSTIDSSQVYPDCLGALPIFLHRFSVTKQGATNVVNWRTLLESGLEHFEVERSSDGINYWSIHSQPARNTEEANEYSFIDNNAPGGVNYYRLKMVERDNVIRYSMVIKVSTNLAKRSLFVSPNPVINNFSLSYQTESSGAATIHIKDITGKILKTFTDAVTKGNNVIYIQNMADWRPGVYIISLQQGNSVEHTKFVKADK